MLSFFRTEYTAQDSLRWSSVMGFIPDDAEWYVADLVVEITIEGSQDNVVHTNTVLVRADSPEEAYTKAMELGQRHHGTHLNREGKQVTTRFRGLMELNVIHDELEHGAEISYQENIGVPEDELARWIPPREELGVFRPRDRSLAPNYSNQDVLEKLHRQFPDLKPPEEDPTIQ